MKYIACLFPLVIAFTNSYAEAEDDKCLLISIATESKEFDVTWENEDAMKLVKQFKQDHDEGNDAHQDIGEFSIMKHGGNWTFHVELNSKYRIDANVSIEFPPEVTAIPNFIWVEAKSMDSRFTSAHLHEIYPLNGDRNHWVGDLYARMNLTELVAQGDPFKLSLFVGMDYRKLTSKHTTQQLCEDPKSVVESAQSTDGVEIESSDSLSRVAVAWKISGAGNFYHLASDANTFITLASVSVFSDELYVGRRTFVANLWNFGTFKTIEIVVKDDNPESGIEHSRMNVTIVPEDHETLLTDMSRYLIQTKRAELYVNETDLSALKDSFTIVLTFDPTPGQLSV